MPISCMIAFCSCILVGYLVFSFLSLHITGLSFSIVIVFGNVQNPKTHVVKNCEFLNDGVEAAQGDTAINRSFDFVASHIQYN